MSDASTPASTAKSLSWTEICARYPHEWVCLLDIEHEPDGAVRTARVVVHDPDFDQALDLLGVNPDATVVEAWGRPRWKPHSELLDEGRDSV